VEAVINRQYSQEETPIAHAENASVIEVAVPKAFATRIVEFIATLEKLTIEPEHVSRIVVNERTGTIVMGKDVHVAPVAIMHGALTIEVQTQLTVSQPAPQSQGKTEVVPQTQMNASEEKARNLVFKDGATIEDLVRGLNAIGSTARDIIAILQNLRAAGALDAELEVI
jgi:flagellar P-ring protein precursor FlgI